MKKSSIKKDGTVPIYARIWIDSIPIDVSTKEAISEEHWCVISGRAKTRTKNAKDINELLDDVNSKIKTAYRQLKDEGRLITVQAIKQRYLGKDKAILTYKDLIEYHREKKLKKLAQGTIKNYGTTEMNSYTLKMLNDSLINVVFLQV